MPVWVEAKFCFCLTVIDSLLYTRTPGILSIWLLYLLEHLAFYPYNCCERDSVVVSMPDLQFKGTGFNSRQHQTTLHARAYQAFHPLGVGTLVPVSTGGKVLKKLNMCVINLAYLLFTIIAVCRPILTHERPLCFCFIYAEICGYVEDAVMWPKFRPTLLDIQNDSEGCSVELAALVRRCWSEDLLERPDFSSIKNSLKRIDKLVLRMSLWYTLYIILSSLTALEVWFLICPIVFKSLTINVHSYSNAVDICHCCRWLAFLKLTSLFLWIAYTVKTMLISTSWYVFDSSCSICCLESTAVVRPAIF